MIRASLPSQKQARTPIVPLKQSRKGRSRKQAKRENAFGSGLGMGAMAPAAVSAAWGLGKAKWVSPIKGGCLRIQHSELLGNSSGSVAFAVSSYSLNPGLSNIFPWLSGIANSFEKYRFHKLNIVFRTMKGTSTAGELILAVDFDAADGPPSTKQEMFSYEGAVKCAPWENVMYRCSMQNLSSTDALYTRSTLIAGTDIKTYDVGNLMVATEACADTSIIGDVFLEYDVEFFTPQFSNSSSVHSGGEKISSVGGSNAAVFGTTQTITGTTYATATGTTMTFVVPGEYLVVLYATGTTLANPTRSGTASASYLASPTFGTATSAYFVWAVSANAGQTLILDFSGSASIGGNVITRIAQYDTGLALPSSMKKKDDLWDELSRLKERISKLDFDSDLV